jgi:hypothetical protein
MNEGGIDFRFVCPIHGTRGTNEFFNPDRCLVASRS